MKINTQVPKKALNKAYLKEKVNRADVEAFKRNLLTLFNSLERKGDEEHLKTQITYFLRDTWYKDKYQINPIEKNDLAIHTGKTVSDPIGVLLEVKSIINTAEMITVDKPNAKALHELILYYLRERIDKNNNEIKYLIATSIEDWYLFDANEFDKKIFRNSAIKKLYELKKRDHKDNPFFYEELKRMLQNDSITLEATSFKLNDFRKVAANTDKEDDKKLLALYKLLSPVHLLKQPFANDSNSLDTKFYAELLHIIGLEEVKDGSKKLIRRKAKPDHASLLENTMQKLKDRESLRNIQGLTTYGTTGEEQLYNVALELCITWVNRVLFLKLLEAQLLKYHKGNREYTFLNTELIYDFDELSNLFFGVLAERPAQRREDLQAKFSKVPYLNSSLFERTVLERATIDISSLDNRLQLPLHTATVLKGENDAKRLTGQLATLPYLFRFLDAYDFTSEGGEEIQEENKNLINASVLGLIFEKINGYKDGSFFTPGFVTMYMCRETIRRAVVQKFNDAKGWSCTELDELFDRIEDKKEANAIINSLTICDPAVGSGHFLVSALNELIAIKSELKILLDRQGKTLRDYEVVVENDELIVIDDNGDPFEYNFHNKESQRVQETLFHEKENLIERCLFGVDINPNSVKICRLRLWIELLKHAYYTADSNYTQLETLPNIDINIKTGNSLISRFALDADIKKALRKSKWNIESYKLAVQAYRDAQSKEEKREMEELIETIKKDFRSEISINDKKVKELSKLRGELFNLTGAKELFDIGKNTKSNKKQIEELAKKVGKLENVIEEIKTNKIYENAFEWRFEFPEVLDIEGEFVGFDVLIGNPPYVFARENFDSSIKKYYTSNSISAQYQINLFSLFIEKSFFLLSKQGNYSLIVPNSVLMTGSATKIRELLLKSSELSSIVNLFGYTFDGVNVETVILTGSKSIKSRNTKVLNCLDKHMVFQLEKPQSAFLDNDAFQLNVFSDSLSDKLIEKLKKDSVGLDEIVGIKAGLKAYQAGKGKPKQTPEDVKLRPFDLKDKVDDNTHKYLEGKDVLRYGLKWSSGYLRFGQHLAEPRIFPGPKIIIREITGGLPYCLNATYTEELYLFNISNIAIVPKEDIGISLKYILALLNSKLLSYYFIKNTAKSVRQMFPKLILRDLREFPFKAVSKEKQQPFIDLTNQILNAKASNVEINTSELERQIDLMVYKLYNLTYEEVKIIDEGVSEEEFTFVSIN